MAYYTLGILRETCINEFGRDIDGRGLPENYVVEAVARMAAMRIRNVLKVQDRCEASLEDWEIKAIVEECALAVFDTVFKKPPFPAK